MRLKKLSLLASLINCSMKIITKYLTDRLATCMDHLIDSSQATFIKKIG